MKAYAEAEDKRVETELKRLTMRAKVRESEAAAVRAELEAQMLVLKEIDARIELQRKCQELGVILTTDVQTGGLAVDLPPVGYSWPRLATTLNAVVQSAEPIGMILNNRPHDTDAIVRSGHLKYRGKYIDIYCKQTEGKWSGTAAVRSDPNGLAGDDDYFDDPYRRLCSTAEEAACRVTNIAAAFVDEAVTRAEPSTDRRRRRRKPRLVPKTAE
jgi:hypothetical protein